MNANNGRQSVASTTSSKIPTAESQRFSQKASRKQGTGSQQPPRSSRSNQPSSSNAPNKPPIATMAKRQNKRMRESKATLGIIAVDPISKLDLTPLPLREMREIAIPILHRKNSVERSMGSVSGQVSPSSLSEVSEMERFSYASWGNNGSSTPSTAHSVVSDGDDIFLLNKIPLGESITSGAGSDNESMIDTKMSQEMYTSNEKQTQDREDDQAVEDKDVLSREEIEDLMEQDFTIDLRETPTFFNFEHYDEAVPGQAEYLDEVRETNRRFEEAVKRKLTHKELFTNKEVQTLNKFYKNKTCSTQKTEVENLELTVSGWEIYDEYKKLREHEEKEREEREVISISHHQNGEEEEEEEHEQTYEDDDGYDDNISVRSVTSNKNLMANPKVRDALTVMERAISQNLFHKKQLRYKQITTDDEIDLAFAFKNSLEQREIEEEPKEEEQTEGGEEAKENTAENEEEEKTIKDNNPAKEQGRLDTLWNFECSLSEGQNVNCMAWNRANSDILAVGYGNIDVVGDKDGLILCWTLKNPTFPERYLRIPQVGISSLDFSKVNPSLLSVGYNDGGVAIFDIRKNDSSPVLEASKKHTGTVWDMQWVDKGRGIGERLHSVGVDGRVNSWSIKKGLECQEIMRLKRSSGKGSDQEAAVIARESGGLCIDFDRTDPKLYLVGTEDGVIKKCSTSYTETSLETYIGHTGPVYRVRWNPADPNTFLSCGADWTIRLWNQEKYNPLLTIESFSETMEKRSSSITDVAWSNHISTMFSSVSITGTVDIWDLAYSTLKPKYSKLTYGRQLNSTLFAIESPIVLVGDNFGSVEVLKPSGITEEDFSKEIAHVQFV